MLLIRVFVKRSNAAPPKFDILQRSFIISGDDDDVDALVLVSQLELAVDVSQLYSSFIRYSSANLDVDGVVELILLLLPMLLSQLLGNNNSLLVCNFFRFDDVVLLLLVEFVLFDRLDDGSFDDRFLFRFDVFCRPVFTSAY